MNPNAFTDQDAQLASDLITQSPPLGVVAGQLHHIFSSKYKDYFKAANLNSDLAKIYVSPGLNQGRLKTSHDRSWELFFNPIERAAAAWALNQSNSKGAAIFLGVEEQTLKTNLNQIGQTNSATLIPDPLRDYVKKLTPEFIRHRLYANVTTHQGYRIEFYKQYIKNLSTDGLLPQDILNSLTINNPHVLPNNLHLLTEDDFNNRRIANRDAIAAIQLQGQAAMNQYLANLKQLINAHFNLLETNGGDNWNP